MSDGPFKSRTVAWMVGVAGVSFLLAMVLMIFADEFSSYHSAGTDSFSRSAIGHRAFVQLLRKLDVPVIISRHESGARAGGSAVLIVAEPQVFSAEGERAERLFDIWLPADDILLVLPKWAGAVDPDRREWLGRVQPLGENQVESVLETLQFPVQIVRPGSTEAIEWRSNRYDVLPTLQWPQLMTSEEFVPVISCEQGMLVGEWGHESGRMLVLSDPDVLSNHGLGKGDNAQLAMRILEDLRDGERAVVIDESLHGFVISPSIWRELFDFPLLLVVIQVILTAVTLLWAAALRFGEAAPAPPAIMPGKSYLIDSTAQLLHMGGRETYVLQRYLRRTMEDVSRRLHMPAGHRKNEMTTWLQRVGRMRGVSVDIGRIEKTVDLFDDRTAPKATHVLGVARDIHRWRGEMLHGS